MSKSLEMRSSALKSGESTNYISLNRTNLGVGTRQNPYIFESWSNSNSDKCKYCYRLSFEFSNRRDKVVEASQHLTLLKGKLFLYFKLNLSEILHRVPRCVSVCGCVCVCVEGRGGGASYI